MFARSVSIRLKTNSVAEFTRVIEKTPFPLRRQKGFQDELTFVAPGGRRRRPSACGMKNRMLTAMAATVFRK
jgi:hypothetical protein